MPRSFRRRISSVISGSNKSNSNINSLPTIISGFNTDSGSNPAPGGSSGVRTRRRLLLAGVVLAVLAFSALAVSQYRNTILLLSWDAREFDFGGGSGGRPVPDARCDGGFVAVGFHVRTGEFFNEVWVDCAPMRSDGSLGDERRTTSPTGSPGGRAVRDAQCPPGKVLRGLRGRTGASIDEAVGVCRSLQAHDDRDDYDDRRRDERRDDDRGRRDERGGWGDMTEPVTIPRPGGRPAEAQCPPRSVMVGFRTRSGQYIDHLSILCAEVQRSY